MRILDRYILKNFLVPFIYCFLGFLAIWLVADLNDNARDFMEAKLSPLNIVHFYLTQFPQIIVICLPVGLLLALLYSLSRLSRSNEIISMLGAGQSIPRILMPLFGIGLLATAASMFFNYELAPKAEATKEILLERMTKDKDEQNVLDAQLFRNRMKNRTWYVEKMRQDSNELNGIHIIQQDAEDNISAKYYARRAIYLPEQKMWRLEGGKTVYFDKDEALTHEEPWSAKTIRDWEETPWRISSSHLDAETLSVPELKQYLEVNKDFPAPQLASYKTYLEYRWAFPWTCFIVIFIASPLGIVFSRRGVLVGVASSIFIFFGMIFLTEFFLALGKGGRLSPVVAAWTPNLFFLTLGLVLLYLRSSNRELPKLNLKRAKS